MTKNDRLKEARIKSGMSQEELADKLGVSQAYVGGLESNKSFSLKKAKQIGEILGVNGDMLYFDNNQNTTKKESTIIKNNTTDSKEELISSLRETIQTKERMILLLERENEDLRARLNHYEGKPKTGTN